MYLASFRRKLYAVSLCKSIESAIKLFQIHHGITFVTIHNPAVYLWGARVSISPTLVPQLYDQLPKQSAVKPLGVERRYSLFRSLYTETKSMKASHLLCGAPAAEWVRSLNFSALNYSIISPLCRFEPHTGHM